MPFIFFENLKYFIITFISLIKDIVYVGLFIKFHNKFPLLVLLLVVRPYSQIFLGEKNYLAVKKNMDDILEPPNTEEAMKSHQKWIYTLINEYYDPMYEYQLEKKSHRIIFRGDKTEFLRWSREAD